mmetsp:Transcript_770/g.2376  ORF Transcript_770/g.2376 Transcript_770/m.2376 type:complete len:224 (+) Transcript_770:572-1243(+)
MMVWPILSHKGKIFSLSNTSLASTEPTTTRCCLMTSNDNCAAGMKIWLAFGTTLVAKLLTASLNVALNNNTCHDFAFMERCFKIFVLSTRCPSVAIIWSASSKTKIFMSLHASCRSRIQRKIFPGVPMTAWSTILLLFVLSHFGSAVDAIVIPVYFPMRSITLTFCTTSSRVGQIINPCGALTFGSILLNIPSVKHVVFPLPLCAWAIKFLCGGIKISGNVSA